ncbi:hypothetical protein [Vibrio sp. 10N.261.51.A4]|uniref:hypothetical protein n=1 Tax=Vibrio sp. 10N.261.51.A4 TaxID=3229674 RepID=UPI003551E057
MAKKPSNDSVKDTNRGKGSRGDSGKDQWRGNPNGKDRSQGHGSGDGKPMIHVEPDHPWPRK